MPAPKLLPKKLIAATVATERKQEIDKGIKLVKSIEALREEKIKEEQALDQFRRETLVKVQIEIDAKIAERDAIAAEIPRLKSARIEAQAPINLKEEWQHVREDKAANAEWQERNTQDSLEVLAEKEENRNFAAKLEKEAEIIDEEHKLSLRILQEAEVKHSQADDALMRAEQEAQRILVDVHQRENHLRVREEDATAREVALSKREEAVEAHEIDLANREIKLKSRQETFIKAQAYITSKKK